MDYSDIVKLLQLLNSMGFWDIITIALALFAGWYYLFRKAKLRDVSVHITYYIGASNPLWPNVLNFEVRNLMHVPVVITNPLFHFSNHLKSGNNAHGNTSTGDYEIKFRPIDSQGHVIKGKSYTTYLLNHRDCMFAYVPIDDNLSEREFLSISESVNPSWYQQVFKSWKTKPLGYLQFDAVILEKAEPRVIKLRVPVLMPKRHPCDPPVGRGAMPKQDNVDPKNR
ncbi:IS66 family transposase [Vibrio sp. SS-MA-C1-2]|uniref:IS66 family transposase n=1 Tax=Vibrio sp. SS-MA-C1-2 TaxID=2908646 RepID=UPI001F18C3DB|nr:IS66 family transposase [Vibrio sp. SS-MA-C1-2]UJF18469.1 IS66 family transposase [Vibrio sp. SS-MA-C1-2]